MALGAVGVTAMRMSSMRMVAMGVARVRVSMCTQYAEVDEVDQQTTDSKDEHLCMPPARVRSQFGYKDLNYQHMKISAATEGHAETASVCHYIIGLSYNLQEWPCFLMT